ncbi:MAG: glycosyltransferase family A protein [bacterium]
MKVSIVIPAYNEEKMIAVCLQSLKQQTCQADEIIVVDNNCVDATASIALDFGVKVIREEKQGIAQARGCGFDAATGDIILRCDADTIALPDWVMKTKNHFEKYNSDAVTGPCFMHDRGYGKAFGYLHRVSFFWASRLFQGHHTLFGSNMALKKSAWEKVKNEVCLDNKAMHEDIDLARHLVLKGCSVAYDPTILASISGRRMSDSLPNLFKYVRRWFRTMRLHS